MDSDGILKAELQKALAECQRLRDENAQLRLTASQSTDTLSSKPESFSGHICLYEADRKARQKKTEESCFDQDETFAYIADYTAAGFAFGVTWEE
jgi:hypothetical protein